MIMKINKRTKIKIGKFRLPDEERDNCVYLLDLIIGFNRKLCKN